jgi:hypothetical protein
MADEYCDVLVSCTNLDGQLLIEQTLQGPPLAVGGDIGVADMTGRVVLRPYIRFRYMQSWVTKELCKGPVRSVLGLAPSETMTYETRQVEQMDFVRLVQETSEKSEVVSTSGPAQLMDNAGTPIRDFVALPVIVADKFSSFWETVGEIGGAVIGAAVGGPIGAGIGAWVGGAVGGWIGGDGGGGSGTGNDSTQGSVDQVLESVTRSQSERTLTETTTSRSSLFERTITRTFTNPYRDRALQLRFIPVFRHFDVVTVFWEFEPGLVVNVFAPRFRGTDLSARLGDFIQRQVTDPRIVATASAELGIPEQPAARTRSAARAKSPLTEHLNANSEFYAKRYLKHLEGRRDMGALQEPVITTLARRQGTTPSELDDIGRSLRWSRARVQGKSIYTPFAPPDILVKALPGLQNYEKAISRLETFRLKRVERHKDVHLFAGTIVEPAPGECVLTDLPHPQ